MDLVSQSKFVPPRARPWLRRLGYVAAAAVALLLLAWLAIPPIVRSQLESRLTQALGRTTTVESVAFDPFRLRFTIRNLAIADRAGTRPLVALEVLIADFSSASLWHRAPVLDALAVVRPRVSLARDRDGHYSIQDLIDSAFASTSGPARFSVNNIEVDDGAILFTDGVTGRTHELAAMNVGIPFLSSLPYQTEIVVKPHVTGTFNGTGFALGGTTVPFGERREATLDIDIDALPLPPYVVYLPGRPRFELAGGTLTTRLKAAFVEVATGERRLELRGDARTDGVSLKRRDGTLLASAARIALGIERIDLFGRDVSIAALTVDAPVIDVKRFADGALEWAGPLTESPPVAAATPQASRREPPVRVHFGKVVVNGGTLALVDEGSTFRSTLIDVALDATNVGNRPGDKAHVRTSFVSADRIASFSAEADVEPLVPTAVGRFTLAKFSLGLLFPFYRSALAVDVQKGSLDYATAFALDNAGHLRLTEGEATITDLRLAAPGNPQPMSQVQRLALHQVDVDVPSRKVTVGELQGNGGTLRVEREADGSFEMTRLMKVAETGKPAAGAQSPADVKPATDPKAPADAVWTLMVRKLGLDHFALDVEDRQPQPPFKIALRELTVGATGLSSAPGATTQLTLRAQVGKQGRVAFTGPVARNPLHLAGQLDVSAFSLVTLKPYIEPRVNVVLTDGMLQAKGRLALDLPDNANARASWKGDVTITDFAAIDKPTSSDLARWKSLALAEVDVVADPFRASFGRIDLADFFARLIVYPDASLNVLRLLTPGASAEPAPDAPQAPATAATGPRQALPIAIGHIELAGGNVNFSDFYVQPNYSANLTEVAGSVSAMSPDQAGELKLSARVENTAPVEVAGRLHPFAKELSLDIAATARDIDLPPLTTYSAKYAGYGIEKGQLTFDVHYQVENRKLVADNRLILDQLKFGPHVDSPTATKLPVLLAVALLKNSRGVIDVKLPISGSLDDPKFSVWGIVVQVIVNLIGKAATAPFALLTAAFGGGEEMSTLAFAPGVATLTPETDQRLDTLGKALGDRPALRLDIAGRADATVDRDALRRAAVTSAMRVEKMKTLVAAGTAPPSVDQVTIEDGERVRWLTAAYREAPIPDRPRNMLHMLSDLPPAEMEAMLLANAKADDDALRALANARALAVKDALIARNVADNRLFVVAPHLGADGAASPEKPSPTRVDLSLR